jgi:hypothetical protein
MYVRIGYFFILVSLVVLFLFVASFQVGDPDFRLLLVGLAMLFTGIFAVRRNRKPSERTGRFRMFGKIRSRNNKDGE